MTDRLTLNVGLRYDLIDRLRRSISRRIPNFVDADRPRARPAASTASPGFEEFGKTPQEDNNNSSRASAPPTTCAATARTSSAAAGASTSTSATPTRTSCSRASARRAARASVFSVDQHGRHPEPRRQLLRRRPADHEHRRARTRSTRTGRSSARKWRAPRHPAAVDEPDLGRLVARARRRRRCSTSTTCTSTARDLGVRWALNTRVNGGDAPLSRTCNAEPGEPDDEHEHRRRASTTASTSASAAGWTTASQLNALVLAGEGRRASAATASTS